MSSSSAPPLRSSTRTRSSTTAPATNIGVAVGESASTVRDNTFDGYYSAVGFSGSGMDAATSAPLIASNTITGTHQSGSGGSGISGGSDSNATIVGNSVSAPGTGSSVGISVNGYRQPGDDRRDAAAQPGARRAHERHRHSRHRARRLPGQRPRHRRDGPGPQLRGPVCAVSASLADVTATNITAWGNAQDISTQNCSPSTRASPRTRSPSRRPPARSASRAGRPPPVRRARHFQTIARPPLRQRGAGDFHLQAASPMIDMGNPAAPRRGSSTSTAIQRAITPACRLHHPSPGAATSAPTSSARRHRRAARRRRSCPAPARPPDDPPAPRSPRSARRARS